MNAYLMRFWGDAFAILAFITPSFYIASIAPAVFPAAHLPQIPVFITVGMIAVCLLGGLFLIDLGTDYESHRAFRQGAFGLCIGITLLGIGLTRWYLSQKSRPNTTVICINAVAPAPTTSVPSVYIRPRRKMSKVY